MKKQYVNPSMMLIEIDVTVDTIEVSQTNDGMGNGFIEEFPG